MPHDISLGNDLKRNTPRPRNRTTSQKKNEHHGVAGVPLDESNRLCLLSGNDLYRYFLSARADCPLPGPRPGEL
jgi:hypothetical protein